jgi:thioester reductase-like protein
VFSADSYLSSLIRGCIELGSAPDIDAPVDMVPVDFVAKALVRLSLQPESLRKIFHLTNPHPFPLSGLIDYMRAFGYPVRRVPYESWKQELLAVGERFETSALYPFGAFITQFKEGPTNGQRYDCAGTIDGLAGTSITCPAVDEELLNIYFSHFVTTGFLEGTGR